MSISASRVRLILRIRFPGVPARLVSVLLLSAQALPLDAGDLDSSEVMQAFRAQGENAFSAETISGFDRPFGSVDSNKDGFLTAEEYVGNSRHFAGNPAGAKGFMKVSDNDGDGRVSRAEYVRNRIVTDEAKEIYTQIDPATDWQAISAFQWRMSRPAFVESDYFTDPAMAEQLFEFMDTNNDDWLSLPEYLMAYGPWARAGLPAEILDGM